MKHPPQTQPTFDESSNLRRRPIVKCPVAPCGYVGRYDNVKRHIKTKHHQVIDGTPAVPQILPSSAEASEVQMASPRGEIEMPVALSQPLPPRNTRTRVCKRVLMPSQFKPGEKKNQNDGFKPKRVHSD